jgi:hypothetical protein
MVTITRQVALDLISDQGANVIIPSGFTSIEPFAFKATHYPNSHLGDFSTDATLYINSVEIPSSIASIGRFAFQQNPLLVNAVLPEGLTSINDGVFYGSPVTNINLPSTLTSIGNYAFWRSELTSVAVPEGVTSIGYNAYQNNMGLESVDLPSTLASIGNYAFWNTDLTSVELPENTTVGNNAFDGDVSVSFGYANTSPTGIDISSNTFDENIAADTAIGTLNSVDSNDDDTFTYSLVDGDGDLDNSAFSISGDELIINDSPDYETQDSYSIRIQTEDSGGETYVESITLGVNNINEAPDANDDVLAISAGLTQSELVDVSANDDDPDAGTTFTVTLSADTELNINEFASLVGNDIQVDASFYADMLPGGDDLIELVDYTISDGELTDAAQITVTITAPDADGTVISTSLADFDSFSSDLHGSIIGINDAAVDVDGSATVQTPVVLNSDSSASVVSGDAKAVADTDSIEGITDSSFDIASDLDMAASVQSTLDSSATSTNGIAVSNSLIGAQQGIELTDVDSVDAIDVGGIANISVGSSMSAASVAETVGNGTGNSGSLGVDGSWSNAIADDLIGLGSGDLGGILGIDVASDASISSSLASSLSAEATADAGLAVSNAALNASTGMEDLAVEVGGLGLVSSINQSELDSTASSTKDDTSAIGLNELASGILNSDFNFSDVDSVMSAQTISLLDIEASTTTGDAWSSLDSASVGFEGAISSITGAAEITAIASDQGFAESATVAGQATAMADQSAIGMDGYSINNSSDLQLTALAEVDSTADSSATMS